MAKETKYPITPAIRVLRAADVGFTPCLYRYEERGGTAASARELGVDEHTVIKTLVFETGRKDPLIVLMHGDREVLAKELARVLGTKSVAPCRPEVADRHSGYQVGGTSPFGTRRPMPVYMQRTILDLEAVHINGGARGFLIRMSPRDIEEVLSPVLVDVAI